MPATMTAVATATTQR